MIICAFWLGIGVVLVAWSYRKGPRPAGWWKVAAFLALVWPLAIVGYLIELIEHDA